MLMDSRGINGPSNQKPTFDFEIQDKFTTCTCFALKLIKISLLSTSTREGSANTCWIGGRKLIWK